MIGAALAACVCALLVKSSRPRKILESRTVEAGARAFSTTQRRRYLDRCGEALDHACRPGARACVRDATGSVHFLPVCGAIPAAVVILQTVEGASRTTPILSSADLDAWTRGICPGEVAARGWAWQHPAARALFWRMVVALELSADTRAAAITAGQSLTRETMQMAALCPARDSAGDGALFRALEGRMLPADAILG